jgi:hypothetical protein
VSAVGIGPRWLLFHDARAVAVRSSIPKRLPLTQAKGASRRIVLEAADVTEWTSLCKVFAKNPTSPDEKVKTS